MYSYEHVLLLNRNLAMEKTTRTPRVHLVITLGKVSNVIVIICILHTLFCY